MRSQSPQHMSHGRKREWDASGVLLDESIALSPIPDAAGNFASIERMDFPAIFGNAQPVEIEIGTGKGTFLLARASARPEINFLGIEWASAYCLYAADRMKRAGLTNVRMLRADAGPLFKDRIADASAVRVHIYFPDPWPKTRHHRRRLIQSAFVGEVRRVLRPGGELLIVTDHLGYFEHITQVFADGANSRGFAPMDFPPMADKTGEVVGTNFERKYIAQGRPVHKLALRLGE